MIWQDLACIVFYFCFIEIFFSMKVQLNVTSRSSLYAGLLTPTLPRRFRGEPLFFGYIILF